MLQRLRDVEALHLVAAMPRDRMCSACAGSAERTVPVASPPVTRGVHGYETEHSRKNWHVLTGKAFSERPR